MNEKQNIEEELILKILSNEATDAEKKDFKKWIDLSEKNQKTFLQMKRLWSDSEEIHDYYKINQEKAWNRVHQKTKPQPKRRILLPLLKIASVILIAYSLGILTMYFVKSNESPEKAVNHEIYVKAPKGAKSEIELSDGTKVWLNSGSEIHYPALFSQNQRNVYLVGEAYFEVEKNKKAPFLVHTDAIDVKVLGTHFNVRAYPKEDITETILLEGAVTVNKKGSAQTIQLKPNEKATLRKGEQQLTVSKNIDTELYTVWKNKTLTFKREDLGTVIEKMKHWYNIPIIIKNDDLKKEKVTGSFEGETVEQALTALKLSISLTYEMKKDSIIIK